MKNQKPSTVDRLEQSLDQEDSFLQRWSKRKLDEPTVSQGEADGELDIVSPADQQQELKRDHPALDESKQVLTDEDMPPVETLDENSDFSGFLSPKVSETLRRQALRKLFHMPKFNITDGLDDYDENFTSFEKLGNVVTQEMRNQMQHEVEKSREKNNTKPRKQDNSEERGKEVVSSDNVSTTSESHNIDETEDEVTEDTQINPPLDA